MKLAVTGGAGFIGSHVVDHLLAAGHDIVVIDSRPPHRPDVEHSAADLRDLDGLVAATRDCDAIFHLAAVSNVNEVFDAPVDAVDINVTGTTPTMPLHVLFRPAATAFIAVSPDVGVKRRRRHARKPARKRDPSRKSRISFPRYPAIHNVAAIEPIHTALANQRLPMLEVSGRKATTIMAANQTSAIGSSNNPVNMCGATNPTRTPPSAPPSDTIK